MSAYCIASPADRIAAAHARLTEIDAELRDWRSLNYNAAQILNGKSFGRTLREIERLEREQDALREMVR